MCSWRVRIRFTFVGPYRRTMGEKTQNTKYGTCILVRKRKKEKKKHSITTEKWFFFLRPRLFHVILHFFVSVRMFYVCFVDSTARWYCFGSEQTNVRCGITLFSRWRQMCLVQFGEIDRLLCYDGYAVWLFNLMFGKKRKIVWATFEICGKLFEWILFFFVFLVFSDSGSESGSHKSIRDKRASGPSGDGKPTRVRTVLNEKQLQTLR